VKKTLIYFFLILSICTNAIFSREFIKYRPFLNSRDTLFVGFKKDSSMNNIIVPFHVRNGKIGGYSVYGFMRNNVKVDRLDSIGYLGMDIYLNKDTMSSFKDSLSKRSILNRILSIYDLRDTLKKRMPLYRYKWEYWHSNTVFYDKIFVLVLVDEDDNYHLRKIEDINYFYPPSDAEDPIFRSSGFP